MNAPSPPAAKASGIFSSHGYANPAEPRAFWRDVFAWSTSVTPRVFHRLMLVGLFALGVVLMHERAPWTPMAVTHVQYTGAVLVLLMVLRTNASYDRWWEGRRLWGGIVNQSRNVALRIVAHVQGDEVQKARLVSWVVSFSYACMRSLRGQRQAPEFERLLGKEADTVLSSAHMPSAVVATLLAELREARTSARLSEFEFLQMDHQLAVLIDHIGGCERILKTPLPLVHRVKLRRFIFLYLVAFPFVLVSVSPLLTPVITMLVAYPLLAIDQMAQELEAPFSEDSLAHLPLGAICQTIERTVPQLGARG